MYKKLQTYNASNLFLPYLTYYWKNTIYYKFN